MGSNDHLFLKYHKNTYKYKDLGYYYEIMMTMGHNEVFMAMHEPSMIPDLFKWGNLSSTRNESGPDGKFRANFRKIIKYTKFKWIIEIIIIKAIIKMPNMWKLNPFNQKEKAKIKEPTKNKI